MLGEGIDNYFPNEGSILDKLQPPLDLLHLWSCCKEE